MTKYIKKSVPDRQKNLSSSLHFVNVSPNYGNCLPNSDNSHLGIKHLLWQMEPLTLSSAVSITLEDQCVVYENNL